MMMDFSARAVIVPLSFASLITGLVQSLGTHWGLFRHHWVLAKLVINVFANAVLLIYLPSLERLGAAAAEAGSGELAALRDSSPILHSSAALALLLVATVLGVYKPRGLTKYGWNRRAEKSRLEEAVPAE
ncbi:MAG: DUF2269 domain-containing protein [Actinomycetota bacterium]